MWGRGACTQSARGAVDVKRGPTARHEFGAKLRGVFGVAIIPKLSTKDFVYYII